MVTLLRRLFIRDYQNVANARVRTAHGKLAAVFGIITNAILVALKLTAAFLLASQNAWIFSAALIGDAINNAGDMASSFVTLLGFILAGKPADKEHPFGHQRIEYIAGLIVAILVAVSAVELGISSVEKLINRDVVSYDTLTLIFLGVAIVLKVFQFFVNRGLGKAIDSPSLKATSMDSLNDSLATSLVLLSALFQILWGWQLDGYLGLALAVFVLVSGVKMMLETANPLIGEAIPEDFAKNIVDDVLKHEEIKGVHDVICHSYGPNNIFISLHAEVDEREPIGKTHEVIDDIEKEIRETRGCEITIHMDPISIGDPIVDALHEEVKAVLKELDEELMSHDFRVVRGTGHTNLIFDVVIPYSKKKLTEEMILEALKIAFREKGDYRFVITFDRPFVA